MCEVIIIFLTGTGISGLVVEYIVAIDVTRVRFPADAFSICFLLLHNGSLQLRSWSDIKFIATLKWLVACGLLFFRSWVTFVNVYSSAQALTLAQPADLA